MSPARSGMVRHPREDLPQAVLGDAEAQPLLQGLRGLFEDDDFQPVADAAEVRSRPVRASARPCRGRGCRNRPDPRRPRLLGLDPHRLEQRGGLALGVEQRDLPGSFRRCGRRLGLRSCTPGRRAHAVRGGLRQHVDREGVLLHLAVAELEPGVSSYCPGDSRFRQREVQRNTLLLARRDGYGVGQNGIHCICQLVQPSDQRHSRPSPSPASC